MGAGEGADRASAVHVADDLPPSVGQGDALRADLQGLFHSGQHKVSQVIHPSPAAPGIVPVILPWGGVWRAASPHASWPV